MRISKPPQERRAELVAAARALFDEKGVEATRVSDIVKRVGVAQGAFYYYFSSKADVVEAALRQVSAEVDARAEEILRDETEDYGKKLAAFIELILGLIDQFSGEGEQRLPAVRLTEGGRGSVALQCVARLKGAMQTVVLRAAAAGAVTAAYPWPAALVTLYGLRALAERQIPGRAVIYALTEENLGMPKGSLMKYMPEGP